MTFLALASALAAAPVALDAPAPTDDCTIVGTICADPENIGPNVDVFIVRGSLATAAPIDLTTPLLPRIVASVETAPFDSETP